MATTIKLKNSVTTTNTPSSLAQGEVAINITDKKVWVGNAATTPVQLLGAGSSASFGALTCTSLTNSGLTSGRVTYAGTGGLLQDDADFTFNGTTVTMANDASISGLTVGKGGGAVATNTAVGVDALKVNEAGGNNNTAVGYQAADSNTTGDFNTAIGSSALQANTTASNNTAVGYQAGYSNTTAINLAFFGYNSGFYQTGNNNTGIGVNSLFGASGTSTGTQNTAVGKDALYSNTTASNNTAVGYQAGYSNTTGRLTAVGMKALYANTTGDANVAIGGEIGGVGGGALANNTTGGYNIAIGTASLSANTTASNNVAVGHGSLGANTTGNNNVGIGLQALLFNTTASFNTAVGYQAGYSNATSSGNVFLGTAAGYTANTTGNTWNTFVGAFTGYSVTTGKGNTFIGTSGSTGSVGCGYYMTTGSDNVIVGGYTGNLNSYDMRTLSNRVVISDGLGNRQLTMYDGGTVALGNSAVPQAGTGITFPATQSASSDANTLDDYEEGDWTPVLAGSSGTSGQSYSRQKGKYTKVGRLVTCTFDVVLTAVGTVSGEARITGLPFTVASDEGFRSGLSVGEFSNLAANYVQFGGVPLNSTTQIYIRALTAAAATSTAPNATSAWTNTTQVMGTFSYFV
jgi:hypothetical protein